MTTLYKRREIFLTDTKTGLPRVVPLSDLAISQIHSQVRYLHSTYIFNNPKGARWKDVTGSLKGACERAGLEGFRWHDLRKTCGSWMLQGGMDINKVSKILGHSSVLVTERSYAFLRNIDLHNALAKLTKSLTDTTDK